MNKYEWHHILKIVNYGLTVLVCARFQLCKPRWGVFIILMYNVYCMFRSAKSTNNHKNHSYQEVLKDKCHFLKHTILQ